MICLIISVRLEKVENNEKGSNNSSGIESQAAKRQKLEGGHLCKVNILTFLFLVLLCFVIMLWTSMAYFVEVMDCVVILQKKQILIKVSV